MSFYIYTVSRKKVARFHASEAATGIRKISARELLTTNKYMEKSGNKLMMYSMYRLGQKICIVRIMYQLITLYKITLFNVFTFVICNIFL